MATTENVETDPAAFVMPVVSTVTASERGTVDTRPIVVDNPGYAWRNSNQACLQPLHSDLVHDHREALDIVAIEAVGELLADEWAARGYVMTHGTDDEVQHRPGQPDNPTYWAVWDHIAGQLDPDALVTAAGLDDLRHTTYSD